MQGNGGRVREGIFCLAALALCLILLKLSGVTCLFRAISGIPCPACGMFRAALAIIRGDIKAYFHYNAFCVPIGICVLIQVLSVRTGRNADAFCAAVCALNLAYYIFRLKHGLIP